MDDIELKHRSKRESPSDEIQTLPTDEIQPVTSHVVIELPVRKMYESPSDDPQPSTSRGIRESSFRESSFREPSIRDSPVPEIEHIESQDLPQSNTIETDEVQPRERLETPSQERDAFLCANKLEEYVDQRCLGFSVALCGILLLIGIATLLVLVFIPLNNLIVRYGNSLPNTNITNSTDALDLNLNITSIENSVNVTEIVN